MKYVLMQKTIVGDVDLLDYRTLARVTKVTQAEAELLEKQSNEGYLPWQCVEEFMENKKRNAVGA